MKKLLVLLSLFAATQMFAQDPPPPAVNCLTNCTVFMVNGSTGSSTNYGGTNVSGSMSGAVLIASDCDNGPTMTFFNDLCIAKPHTIAVVYYSCDTSQQCGGGYCPDGNAITIKIPAGKNSVTVRIFSIFGCCSLTYCVVGSTPCPSAQPGGC